MDSSTITVFEGFLYVLGFCLLPLVVERFPDVATVLDLPLPLKISFKEKRPPLPKAEREDFVLDFPVFRPPKLLSAPFFPPLLPAKLWSPRSPLAEFPLPSLLPFPPPLPPPFPLSPPLPLPPPLPFPPLLPLPSFANAISGTATVATMAVDPNNAIARVDAFSSLKLVIFISTSSVEISGYQFSETTRYVQ
ncbi:hypothetical protein I5192_01530 [Ruegeria sp. SCSIO 43209]|uniref:hypothetical protein n=1 Tax=Ruegeria sp. SCSIO 43209 TaxID=2793010 RepID=UPI001CA99EC5|nr:hypothetical protein [Ruegeria sp. SCSIO 43209]UAB89392.1 hypothetical protein I5192_01530 [Ruegeria sp. SCSIO 43209]